MTGATRHINVQVQSCVQKCSTPSAGLQLATGKCPQGYVEWLCPEPTAASPVAPQQIPIDKAGEGQREKHGAGDGVKLPALRCNLACTTLQ